MKLKNIATTAKPIAKDALKAGKNAALASLVASLGPTALALILAAVAKKKPDA